MRVEQASVTLALGARLFSAAITASPDFGAPLSTTTKPSPVEKAVTLAPPASITASVSVSLVTPAAGALQQRAEAHSASAPAAAPFNTILCDSRRSSLTSRSP